MSDEEQVSLVPQATQPLTNQYIEWQFSAGEIVRYQA